MISEVKKTVDGILAKHSRSSRFDFSQVSGKNCRFQPCSLKGIADGEPNESPWVICITKQKQKKLKGGSKNNLTDIIYGCTYSCTSVYIYIFKEMMAKWFNYHT